MGTEELENKFMQPEAQALSGFVELCSGLFSLQDRRSAGGSE